MPSTFNPNTATTGGLGKQAIELLRQGSGETTLTATIRRLAVAGLVEIIATKRKGQRIWTSFVVTEAGMDALPVADV